MSKSAYDRIKEKIVVNEFGCHIYQQHLDKDGYGQISDKSKTRQTHKVVFENVKGEVPKGMLVGHLCDEKYPVDSKAYRACCNPEHLIACSPKENIQRAVQLGRYVVTSGAFKKGDQVGEKNKNAKLKDEDIIEIRRKHPSFKYGEFKKYAEETLAVAYITCQKYVTKNDDGTYKKRPELIPL